MRAAYIFTALLFMSITASAQFQTFIEMGIDPKMAIEGPYKGKVNDTNGGTFNAEFKAGFEWEKQRVGFGFETHAAIKYEKWSAFYDQKFSLNNDKFYLYLGGEISAITRRDEYTSDHRPHTTTPSYGANLGLYYDIWHNRIPTGFTIGINGNAFRGETEYKMYKSGYWNEFRKDFMIVIIRKF